MTRTTTYVYASPFGPRDYTAFRTAAEGYKYAEGLTAQRRASYVVETTGNSYDEHQQFLREFRARYIAGLAATVAGAAS